MFGMGMPEIILIMAVALIVIGPKKLPELAKTLGKAFGEFRKATSDLKDTFTVDIETPPAEKKSGEIKKVVLAAADTPESDTSKDTPIAPETPDQKET